MNRPAGEPLPLLRWTPVSAAPALAPAALHLWRLPLDGPAAAPLADCDALLAHAERARAARLRVPHRRARWIRARALARRVLGLYLGRAPQAVEFVYGGAGKPALAPKSLPEREAVAPPRVLPEVEFNLTHTGPVGVLAVSPAEPVGVDCERLRPCAEAVRIAERMFAPGEAEAIARLAGGAREHAFYRAWTALEARVKADGRGLAAPAPGAGRERLQVRHALVEPGILCAVARASLPPVRDWSTLALRAGG